MYLFFLILNVNISIIQCTGEWNLSLFCPLPPERHDALYVVGALDEAMELRGMRYHPIDIETSVIRAHKSITEW